MKLKWEVRASLSLRGKATVHPAKPEEHRTEMSRALFRWMPRFLGENISNGRESQWSVTDEMAVPFRERDARLNPRWRRVSAQSGLRRIEVHGGARGRFQVFAFWHVGKPPNQTFLNYRRRSEWLAEKLRRHICHALLLLRDGAA